MEKFLFLSKHMRVRAAEMRFPIEGDPASLPISPFNRLVLHYEYS